MLGSRGTSKGRLLEVVVSVLHGCPTSSTEEKRMDLPREEERHPIQSDPVGQESHPIQTKRRPPWEGIISLSLYTVPQRDSLCFLDASLFVTVSVIRLSSYENRKRER
jgi:hypothetical protein